LFKWKPLFCKFNWHVCEEKKCSDQVFNSTANHVCGSDPCYFDVNDNNRCSEKWLFDNLYGPENGICVHRSTCGDRKPNALRMIIMNLLMEYLY
jgi:hypothetical protein